MYYLRILALGSLFVSPILAQPIYEPFDYASGSSLAGQGGWLLNSGSGGTIETGNLSVPSGMPASIGNRLTWGNSAMSLRLPLTAITSGSIYFSFALRIDNVGAFTGSETIAGLGIGTTTTFAPKINVISNSFQTYQIGIYKGAGTGSGALAPNLFSSSDTVFVVGRYTFNSGSTTDDTCDLWLNPDSSTFGTGTADTPTIGGIGVGAADMTQIDRFFWRTGGSASPVKKTVDELRIGYTWADVTPVPEPGTAALLVLSIATLFGFRFSRQRQ